MSPGLVGDYKFARLILNIFIEKCFFKALEKGQISHFWRTLASLLQRKKKRV